MIPLQFGSTSAVSAAGDLCRWIEQGLTHDDLSSLSMTQLAYPSAHPITSVSSQQLSAVVTALKKRCGEPLLVSLCERSNSKTPLTVKLTRPVAVRVVQIGTSVGGPVRVTLQPCVLVTSTAVNATDARAPLNRYIYSVRLTE